MKESAQSQSVIFNGMFWVHLLIMVLAWTGPFLVSWWLMILAYLAVQFQYAYFKKCLMNEKHDLQEHEDNYTFYAWIFEQLGFNPNRKRLKFYVRNVYNYCLGTFTIFWQVVLGNEPLLFF
ncbi:hypothetical protein OAF63_05020 [Saprospiraceae bacterium]|jgi:hypothetical protein|nr:hypothetical protein [Bacteroidota bacterium]MDB4728135.1 hypothetical protein [Saprospiraceae bacterium]MDF1866378.1 hypothetical protein [Saprospiraceae bacterium]